MKEAHIFKPWTKQVIHPSIHSLIPQFSTLFFILYEFLNEWRAKWRKSEENFGSEYTLPNKVFTIQRKPFRKLYKTHLYIFTVAWWPYLHPSPSHYSPSVVCFAFVAQTRYSSFMHFCMHPANTFTHKDCYIDCNSGYI